MSKRKTNGWKRVGYYSAVARAFGDQATLFLWTFLINQYECTICEHPQVDTLELFICLYSSKPCTSCNHFEWWYHWSPGRQTENAVSKRTRTTRRIFTETVCVNGYMFRKFMCCICLLITSISGREMDAFMYVSLCEDVCACVCTPRKYTQSIPACKYAPTICCCAVKHCGLVRTRGAAKKESILDHFLRPRAAQARERRAGTATWCVRAPLIPRGWRWGSEWG